MLLNRCNLINALASIENPGLIKNRTWDSEYNGKTCTYWNNILWDLILANENITGSTIDKYEFYKFCGYYCSNEKADQIFKMINKKSRSILFVEFEELLEKIDAKDYINIMNSLELEPEILVKSNSNTELQFELELDNTLKNNDISINNCTHNRQVSWCDMSATNQTHSKFKIRNDLPIYNSDNLYVPISPNISILTYNKQDIEQNTEVESTFATHPLSPKPPLPNQKTKKNASFFEQLFDKIVAFFS